MLVRLSASVRLSAFIGLSAFVRLSALIGLSASVPHRLLRQKIGPTNVWSAWFFCVRFARFLAVFRLLSCPSPAQLQLQARSTGLNTQRADKFRQVVDQSTKYLLEQTNIWLLPQTKAKQNMSKIDTNDWQRLSLSVGEVNRTVEAALRAECDLWLTELELLTAILQSKERSLRMGELRDLLLLTPSGLTRVVDRLVRRKLLRRVTVSVDKRGSAVAMTPHGFATYLRAKEVCDLALQSALADKLSGTQLRTLIRTLQPATTPSRT